MRKFRISALITALLILCFGIICVQAETQPTEVINPTEAVVQPQETIPVQTEPVESIPDATEPATDVQPTTGTETTDPSGVTEPSTVVTEPVETARPTEYSEPSTYSDYVSPAPIYTPGDQDFKKNDWENIELNISDKPSGGTGSFINIKNNTSKEDSNNPLLLVGCIAFWFLALSAITFLILYRPEKKAVAEVATDNDDAKDAAPKRKRRYSSKKGADVVAHYEKKYSDDYNDGF